MCREKKKKVFEKKKGVLGERIPDLKGVTWLNSFKEEILQQHRSKPVLI